MASSLLEQCDLVSDCIRTIDARCKALSTTYPDLNSTTTTDEQDQAFKDPDVAKATSVALAAAAQLIANLQSPYRTLLDASLGCLMSAALGVVTESSTAEIIREAGPKGCHVDTISQKNGMDSSIIERVLRPLATQHIFREVSPNVFAHNRISILLDTGKRSEDIMAAPSEKYEGAQGCAALISLNTDETFKAAAYIPDVVLDPSRRGVGSDSELNTPLNRAFNTNVDLFSWYERSDNAARFKRFGMAMDVSRKMSPPSSALDGFDWSALPPDSLVVDVGGGIGSTSLEIARDNAHLRFLIQDKPSVIVQGEQHWKRELPDALSNRAMFEAHDFFEPQSRRDAAIFLLRFICHDWSDSLTSKILRHLRDAAQPTTKLIVMEHILPFVCGEDATLAHIPGAVPDEHASELLLANMGIVGMVPYLVDMQMMALLKGCERTFPHYVRLFREAGWEIEEVKRREGALVDQLVAQPSI